VAGTLVRAEHGLVPIEKLKPGDRVWSRNMVTGKDELQPVHAVYTRTVTRLLTFTVTGKSVTTTVDHPFHVAGQGFTRAISLKPRDFLTTSAGTIPLEAKSLATETVTVYNLNIANTHTYYVVVGESSLLTHNAKYITAARDSSRGAQRAEQLPEARWKLRQWIWPSSTPSMGMFFRCG
jgi:hypothetical protein